MTAGSQLQIPGITVTDTGATIVGPVDHDAVLAAMNRLSRSASWTRWIVGDLYWALVADDDGDQAAATAAVAELGFDQAWLATSIDIAAAVPPANRRPGLSWGHHEAVAHLDVDVQSAWLGRAVACGWTVRTLRQAVKDDAQAQLDLGDDDEPVVPRRRQKLTAAVVARIFETAAVSPSGWVRVCPATGEVRADAAVSAVDNGG